MNTHLCRRLRAICARVAVFVSVSAIVSLSVHGLGILRQQTRLVLRVPGAGWGHCVLSVQVFLCLSQGCVFVCMRRCVSVCAELQAMRRKGRKKWSGPCRGGGWRLRLKGKGSPKVRTLRIRGTWPHLGAPGRESPTLSSEKQLIHSGNDSRTVKSSPRTSWKGFVTNGLQS